MFLRELSMRFGGLWHIDSWHFCLDVTLQGELMLEMMAKSWWAGHGSLICTKRRLHKCHEDFSIEWQYLISAYMYKQNTCCHFLLEATLLGLPMIWKIRLCKTSVPWFGCSDRRPCGKRCKPLWAENTSVSRSSRSRALESPPHFHTKRGFVWLRSARPLTRLE